MTKSPSAIGGVALWRQIADAIRLDIVGGKLAAGDRLPTEAALAERFSVNRHTVRRALAVLAEQGVVIAEQGRGTFVRSIARLSYPIGRRTRLSEGLRGQASELLSAGIGHRIENASVRIANALSLKPGTKVVRSESLSTADGVPVSRATIWLPYRPFPDFAARLEQMRSITEVFRSYGIADYSRASTRISARHADVEELAALKLVPGAIVLVSEAIDVGLDGVPLSYGLSRFPAERMELLV